MKNNKFNMSFNKFLAGSLSVGFFGAGIVEAVPPKRQEKEEQKEQINPSIGRAVEKNPNNKETEENGWFNYIVDAIKNLFLKRIEEKYKSDKYEKNAKLHRLYTIVDSIKNFWEELFRKNEDKQKNRQEDQLKNKENKENEQENNLDEPKEKLESEQKNEEGEQKEFRSNSFDYKVVLDDLFGNKNYNEILKSFEKMLGSESCALDDVNKLFNVLKVDNTVKDLEKEFGDYEFFKFCSKEAFNLVKMFFVSHKLKCFCESSIEFDFEKIFKTSSDREIGELFSKIRESLEEMISNCSDLCKSGKCLSNKFLENFQKSLKESMSYLEKIEKKYNEEHDEWYFSSGNVPLEENKKMNDQTRKSAERLCEIFQSSFGYDASKSLKGSDKFGISVHISKEFFDSHVQEAQCLNAINDSMRDFLFSKKFDNLREIFKSEEKFIFVLGELEKLLKSGSENTILKRQKNRVDFRSAHNILLRKWQGLLDYYTKVFKVRCEEKFYGKPESKLAQLEFSFV